VLNEYYTTEGMITDGKFYPRNGGTPEPLARFDVKVTPGGAWGSFLQAVRSRRVADLNADVEHGHYSAALCHFANISYRLGEKVSFDHKLRALSDSPEIAQTFENTRANLETVSVNLAETKYQLGRVLKFDPRGERFVGEAAGQANTLLTRDYRKPYVVPHKV
jgi:hypothetical protein